MNKSELDEMQLQKRNMIGNQAYMLLFYLLLIDIGLYGFGVRWLEYPMNVFIIMMGCMTYYMIRIIWNNSYVGPKAKANRCRKIALVIGLASLVAGGISAYFNFNKSSMNFPVSSGDNGAIILLVFSIVALIVLAVVSLISKWQSKGDE